MALCVSSVELGLAAVKVSLAVLLTTLNLRSSGELLSL